MAKLTYTPEGYPYYIPDENDALDELRGVDPMTKLIVGDPWEAAARRTRQQVMPPGGRIEGPTTQVLESIGNDTKKAAVGMATAPYRMIDEAIHQPDITKYGLQPRVSDELLGPALEAAGMVMGGSFPMVAAKGAMKNALGSGAVALETPKIPPFYSAVEHALRSAKQDAAASDQWLGMIRNTPGIRSEELQWLGLEDWLKQQKHPVTKDQIQAYLDSHRVEVKDALNTNTTKDISENQFNTADELVTRWVSEEDTKAVVQQEGGHFLVKMGDDKIATFSSKEAAETEMNNFNRNLEIARRKREDAMDYLENWALEATNEKDIPYDSHGRYPEYQLPGGKNYNELLLTLPGKKETLPKKQLEIYDWIRRNPDDAREYDILDIAQRFGVSEKEAQKISDLARSDKSLPAGKNFYSPHWDEPNILAHVRFNDREIGGKKTLFMEEVQSDWHQEGRKQGYKTGGPYKAVEKSDGTWAVTNYDGGEVHIGNSSEVIKKDYVQRWVKKSNENIEASRVPDAPFKKTWPDLVLKRMIRYAAENGYEKIAWTPGEVQAKRWSGSGEEGHGKFYDEILVNKANELGKKFGSKVRSEGLEGAQPMPAMSGEHVMEMVGPDVRKIYGIPENTRQRGDWWRKMMHDEGNIRDELFEVARQNYSAKPLPIHTLDITPQMRDTALGKGFPLFSSGHMLIPVEGNPFERKDQRMKQYIEQSRDEQDRRSGDSRGAPLDSTNEWGWDDSGEKRPMLRTERQP